MRVNQNISAMAALRNLSTNNDKMTKSLDKLSSGFRINRAADDAAGLVISEGLRSQVGGIKVAMRNAQDGISVVQTAEGALTEVHSILQRMRDLTVQAANTGTSGSAARAAIQDEVDALTSEIDRITETTKFNGVNLLDGSFGGAFKLEGATDNYDFATGLSFTGGDFDIAVAGLDTNNDGTVDSNDEITVDLSAATFNSPAEVKDAFDAALATALEGTGVEMKLQYSVGPDGTTFSLASNRDFDITAAGDLDEIGITGTAAASVGGAGVFQVGANMDSFDKINVTISDLRAAALSVDSLTVDSLDSADHEDALSKIDAAIQTVSTQRGALGALQNRFEHTIANLGVAAENISASESRIRDVDMAAEMASFTRNQIMTQAGTAMLAQANATSQNVLSLLR